MINVLPPVHKDFESAYEIPDYPYGFTLRCSIRFWIETKKNFGKRIVSCTKNPKTGAWNKPKAGNYWTMCVLFVNDENGHLEHDSFSGNDAYREDLVNKWLTDYAAGLSDYELGKLTIYKAMNQAKSEGFTWYTSDRAIMDAAWNHTKEILKDWNREDLVNKLVSG